MTEIATITPMENVITVGRHGAMVTSEIRLAFVHTGIVTVPVSTSTMVIDTTHLPPASGQTLRTAVFFAASLYPTALSYL